MFECPTRFLNVVCKSNDGAHIIAMDYQDFLKRVKKENLLLEVKKEAMK